MSVTLESDAALALRDSIDAAMMPLSGAIMGLKAARATSGWGSGIIDEMRRSIAVIVALEAAADAMDAAHKAAREALKTSMAETGAGNIQSEHFTASLRAVPPKVIVNGPVPDEFMTTPEPRPDLAKIKVALKGRSANWATLSEPSETLVITSRSQKS